MPFPSQRCLNPLNQEPTNLCQIIAIINKMKAKDALVEHRGFWKCTLATTKDMKGNAKHAQVDVKKVTNSKTTRKELVHLIWWRYTNDFKPLPAGEHISHLDKDQQVLNLLSESPEINESRKHCHANGWWRVDPMRGVPRCPHWENPCTGPE